jgi:hypothetical protein
MVLPLMLNLFHELCCLFWVKQDSMRRLARSFHPLWKDLFIDYPLWRPRGTRNIYDVKIQDERLRQHPAWWRSIPMYLAKYFFPYVWFIFEKINNLEIKTKKSLLSILVIKCLGSKERVYKSVLPALKGIELQNNLFASKWWIVHPKILKRRKIGEIWFLYIFVSMKI